MLAVQSWELAAAAGPLDARRSACSRVRALLLARSRRAPLDSRPCAATTCRRRLTETPLKTLARPLTLALLLALALPALAQKVRLATSAGDIVLQLEAEKAPKTVGQFPAVRARRPLRRHRSSTASSTTS